MQMNVMRELSRDLDGDQSKTRQHKYDSDFKKI